MAIIPEIQIMFYQHDALRECVIAYLDLLARPEPDLTALADCRWNLTRLVMTHLAFEDAHLYREIERRGEPAASLGRKMAQETGYLMDAFQAHVQGWNATAILRDWSGFCASARHLLSALNNRMNREEQDLYPLIVAKAA